LGQRPKRKTPFGQNAGRAGFIPPILFAAVIHLTRPNVGWRLLAWWV